jgi:hypothetical protein
MKKLLQSLFVLVFASVLMAQETPKKDATEPTHTQKFYKLSYLIYEVEDGKKINERSYTIPVTTDNGRTRDSWMKVGTRVPVTMKENEVQYLDVGLNISCNVNEQADRFIVFTDLDISSFALPEQGTDPHNSAMPVLRNIKQHFNTIVTPGKPAVVTTMDDINSKKRMQVEVTATRIE